MFAVVEPQAKQLGVTDEQFGLSLESCLDQATDALTLEISDFFRRCGRAKAAEALKVGIEAGRKHAAAVDAKLTDSTLRALIGREFAADMDRLDAAIAQALAPGNASQQSQPSQESP